MGPDRTSPGARQEGTVVATAGPRRDDGRCLLVIDTPGVEYWVFRVEVSRTPGVVSGPLLWGRTVLVFTETFVGGDLGDLTKVTDDERKGGGVYSLFVAKLSFVYTKHVICPKLVLGASPDLGKKR